MYTCKQQSPFALQLVSVVVGLAVTVLYSVPFVKYHTQPVNVPVPVAMVCTSKLLWVCCEYNHAIIYFQVSYHL